jgi:hypothetical protein
MAFPITNINITLSLHYITITNNITIINAVPCTMAMYNTMSMPAKLVGVVLLYRRTDLPGCWRSRGCYARCVERSHLIQNVSL